MFLEKQVLKNGNGVTFPLAGDIVRARFVGWLHDASQIDGKGQQ